MLRSGRMSPREPLRRTLSSVASVGVNCAFCPLGTISESEVKSNVALVVVRFFDGREEFVAQAQVQGEPRSYLEVVETINRIDLPAIVDVGVTLVMDPPSGMPCMKVAKASPPVPATRDCR